MNIEIIALAALIGFIVGDFVAPIRHATTTALNQMGEAVEQDVDQSGGDE